MSTPRMALQEIEAAAQRAADLARQMLAFSGRGHFQLQRLDLGALVANMASVLQSLLPRAVTLVLEAPQGLPAVVADAAQIRQVVTNLALNAAEAIGSRAGSITISAGVQQVDQAYLAATHHAQELTQGSYVYLKVADTGSGMDEATQARMFEPFFSTRFTGRGLGLAAVEGIVRGHQGAIRVCSTLGHGTMVTVLLPIHAPADQRGSSGEPASASDQQAQGATRPKVTVLVVDDEEQVRAVLTRMLDRQGFNVLAASDGQMGVELFRAHAEAINCVLLDLTMPRMGGDEAFSEIRRIRADVPVVLMSGYNHEDATSAFVGRGLGGFLQKPFTSSDLQAVLQRVLGDRV
jgi:CheY-like chemotaxis protein